MRAHCLRNQFQALVGSLSTLLLLTGCGASSNDGAGSGGELAQGGSSQAPNGGKTSGDSGSSGSTTLTGAKSGGSTGQGAATGGTSQIPSTSTSSPAGGTSNDTTNAVGIGGAHTGGDSTTNGGRPGTEGISVGGHSRTTGGSVAAGGKGTGGRSVSNGGVAIGDSAGGAAGRSTAAGGVGGSSSGTAPVAGGASGAPGTATSDSSIVPDPSWTCGMPNGIPNPTLGELVLRATLDVDKTYAVGATQFGNRRLLTVKGGKIEGKQVQATVLTGGMELELTLSNGSIELEEINVLKASDGTLIYMRTCGVAPAGDGGVRIVPDFEVAASKSLAWLNTGKYAGTRVVDAATGKIQLEIYDVSKLSVTDPKVQLKDPAGVPNQSWECSTLTGTKGSTLFTESVTLGSSLAVGTSKNGNRNIIPITGGTIAGGTLLSSLSGSVVSAGADYQLIGGSSAKLDARYALSSKDGEVIVVRNCGPMGSLVPTFETRADGPYAVLNTNKYLSGDPGSASGGVSITFYERK